MTKGAGKTRSARLLRACTIAPDSRSVALLTRRAGASDILSDDSGDRTMYS